MILANKIYTDIPFAHRQHQHAGHCALIHGHNWTFEFTFGCRGDKTDDCDFVIDFGKLVWLKKWIDDKFDHALVLNANDPWLQYLQFFLLDTMQHAEPGVALQLHPAFAKIVMVPSCSCEGLCKYLASQVIIQLNYETGNHINLRSVTVRENSKNFATLNLV